MRGFEFNGNILALTYFSLILQIRKLIFFVQAGFVGMQGPNNLKIRLDKKSLVTHAFREKEIIRLNRNVEDHKHFSYEIDRYDDVSGPNSLLYIPVEHLNKRLPYGILCLYKQRFGSTFSSIDEQIVHGFALQICSKITLLEGPLSSLADCKEKITELQTYILK